MKELAEIAEARRVLKKCENQADILLRSRINGFGSGSAIAMSNLAIAKSILALVATVENRCDKIEKGLNASSGKIAEAIGEHRKPRDYYPR